MGCKLLTFQTLIFYLLFTGYVGVYICRANITVVTQFMIGKFPNVTKNSFGLMLTLGTYAYALGKLISGFVLDSAGNKVNYIFLMSLLGTILTTVAFGFGKSLSVFTASWVVNRFAQSFAWGAMMVLVSQWYPYTLHSRIVGSLSLSYLFGDAFARIYLGMFIYFKFSWNMIMFISAISLTVVWLPSCFLLYSDPMAVGEKEMDPNPGNLYAKESENKSNSIYGPLLKNPGFYILCAICAGVTFIRECLRDWVHVFLVEKAGVHQDVAPLYSALFPVAGGFGSLATGMLMDRFPKAKGIIMGSEGVLLVVTMIVTAFCNYFMEKIHLALALILILIIGFALTGPQALMQVFALDIGGKKATASISSLLDTVGYIFGATSGVLTGSISIYFGWAGVFIFLSLVSLVATFFCVVFWFVSERSKRVEVIPDQIVGETSNGGDNLVNSKKEDYSQLE
jgi:OPA family glycerol-3-phosphate transporter-like MFS transporter